MLCLSAIAVPVFLDTDDTSSHLVRQWARAYYYGHIILPAMCIATYGLYGYITLNKRATHRKHWLTYAAAGVTTLAMVPALHLGVHDAHEQHVVWSVEGVVRDDRGLGGRAVARGDMVLAACYSVTVPYCRGNRGVPGVTAGPEGVDWK
ncbi:Protein of unknown function DUF1772 [Penicillium cf. viridicatum]|uniref:Uncharacterized protein n=1 Tax=Penicillium cf. viridicatum TaxID=2972119 RepID=A0A9W9M7H4_9EURO|nr:Protein of unknown function DUF1772 [Penicillium cf. viridicatum]